MKKDDKAAVLLAQKLFHENAEKFNTSDQLGVYASAMLSLGLALLRGIEGDAFARSYLLVALNDENPLVIKPEKLN